MIVITIDGLNWETASELYKDLFPIQSMRMIYNNVRLYKGSPTLLGMTCLWSGVKIKNFHPEIYKVNHDYNIPIPFKMNDNTPMDLIWDHFERGKYQARYQGPCPYHNDEEYFNFNKGINNMKRLSTEELSLFPEACKDDYDLFWHHTSIIKGGVFMPGPYEQGRIPSLITYDDIRKNKQFKKEVYRFGILRYKEVIRYIQEIAPDEIIVVSADHGTMTDLPFDTKQIDEIPLIVNRDVDLSNVKFQWDVKDFLIGLHEDIRNRIK